MLITYNPVYGDEKAIIEIFRNLIPMEPNGERNAKEIVDKYLRYDDSRCVDLYNKVKSELSTSK